jgi:hypothetical protein
VSVGEWNSREFILFWVGRTFCSLFIRLEYSLHFTRISYDRTARLNAGGFTSTLDPNPSRQLSDSRPLSVPAAEYVFPDVLLYQPRVVHTARGRAWQAWDHRLFSNLDSMSSPLYHGRCPFRGRARLMGCVFRFVLF